MVENSLQYYVSALKESIGNSSVSTAFAGQNSTDNNSTLVGGISSYDECASNTQDSSGGGFLSRVAGAVSSFVGSAVCEVSSTVSDLGQEVDAARGYLDNSARQTPGQRNASFTDVDVRRTFPLLSHVQRAVACRLDAELLPCPALSNQESSAQNQYKLLVRMTCTVFCLFCTTFCQVAAVPDAGVDPAAVLEL